MADPCERTYVAMFMSAASNGSERSSWEFSTAFGRFIFLVRTVLAFRDTAACFLFFLLFSYSLYLGVLGFACPASGGGGYIEVWLGCY